MSKVISLKRVSYGKSSTKIQDREYYVRVGCPVGNAKEIAEFHKNGDLTQILLTDRDGVNIEQIITYSNNGSTYSIEEQPTLFKEVK